MTEEQIKKKLILNDIENVALNFIKSLESKPRSKVSLKVSDDVTRCELEYPVSRSQKLAFNLCTLSQVHKLLIGDSQSTKRDLYYDHKLLYGTQMNLDRSITAVCELLGRMRTDLNIVSSSKGLISGPLTFLNDEATLVDCRPQPVLITECLMDFRIISNAQYIVVVEKDATFQKLLDEKFSSILPDVLLVTGKGYPDICTRKFLRWVAGELRIPLYGLFDADPHGMEILLTYKYGSINDKMEGKGAFIPNIQWIGMKPSDANLFNVADNQYLPLSHKDFKKLVRLKKRAVTLGETEFVNEIEMLRNMQKKLELEAISSIGPEVLVRSLIKPRIEASVHRPSYLMNMH